MPVTKVFSWKSYSFVLHLLACGQFQGNFCSWREEWCEVLSPYTWLCGRAAAFAGPAPVSSACAPWLGRLHMPVDLSLLCLSGPLPVNATLFRSL